MKKIKIISLTKNHHQTWLKLYLAYTDFYHFDTKKQNLKQTWNWLMDDKHPIKGLVAVDKDNNQVIALAHYRAMPSPIRGANIGFLDDLFVDSNYRNLGIAKALIEKIKQIAFSENWDLIRWITKQDNNMARNLYQKTADESDWITYEIHL